MTSRPLAAGPLLALLVASLAGSPCFAARQTTKLRSTRITQPIANTCRLDRPLVSSRATRTVATIDTIVLHHTAIDTVGGSVATLRRRGLSYHFLIDPDGRVLQGLSSQATALHASGANRRSLGISLVGGVNSEWAPSVAQWNSLKRLIGSLATTFPRLRYVVGHGDVRDTNLGEPYGVSFPRLLVELRTEERVILTHPSNDEQPLLSFRVTAQRLLENPLIPRNPVPVAELPVTETATCSDGTKMTYIVPANILHASTGP